ncbi:hypothetical protein [Pedobacter sp. HMWF019]|uniref:hypothetical protein n=1 Tax=Pedobacter sp. HMWF019 TaxID=2056856 RepID=UPI00130489BF|nr:hypothetical protein [Pedobacter sp. HMWF019]
MHASSDLTVSLSDLWNDMATEIEEKLASICNNEGRVNLVQKYLLQELTLDKQLTKMV